MKNTILVFGLMVWTNYSFAQIVDIPDANFKNALVSSLCASFDVNGSIDSSVDTNKDGEIQVNEAEKVIKLNVQNNLIQNISGIEFFNNLQSLDCSNNQIEKLDLSGLMDLNTLSIQFNNIVEAKISNLPKLKLLYINNNSLTEFDFFNLPQLDIINCSDNQLTYINIESTPQLKSFSCSNNKILQINLPILQNLLNINCSNNFIPILDLSNQPSLEFLNCTNNPLIALLHKNGDLPGLNIVSENPIPYICTDENKILYYKNIFPNAEVNSYCSFQPGGLFFSLLGKTIFDENNNGCNVDDKFISNVKIKTKSNFASGFFISNSTGSYFIPVKEGSHTIKPILEYPDYFDVSPDSIIVTFPSTSDTIIQDFCISPKGILKQVELSIIPLTPPARPGFDASYKVVMTNKGNQVENGTLYFAYDEPRMDFVSTDVNPNTQNDGLLSWDFTNLLPFETRYYNVTLNVNSQSETPPVNAGDELLITCNILDNVFLLKQEVVGSYDPNDKTCLEGKTITPEQVGEYVHYLIRFENTGNYAAENVVVKDVIDESTFDVSTLQITDASHEAWARINSNVVEFIFENIQLPFDDATNDGYICFKIKTKPTLVLGNELKNEANIYFDYNLPILTNKTNTVIAIPVGTYEAVGESEIEIFPNPVSDVLRFSGDDKILKVEIFDMSGRLVQVSNVVNGEVNVERLLRGSYVLKMYLINGVNIERILIK